MKNVYPNEFIDPGKANIDVFYRENNTRAIADTLERGKNSITSYLKMKGAQIPRKPGAAENTF